MVNIIIFGKRQQLHFFTKCQAETIFYCIVELTVMDPLERGELWRLVLRGVVPATASEVARRAAMLITSSSKPNLSNNFTKASSHT